MSVIISFLCLFIFYNSDIYIWEWNYKNICLLLIVIFYDNKNKKNYNKVYYCESVIFLFWLL